MPGDGGSLCEERWWWSARELEVFGLLGPDVDSQGVGGVHCLVFSTQLLALPTMLVS